MLQVCRYSDARAFLMRAESWLLGAEIQHAMALESARHARSDDSHYQKPVFWATVEDDSQIIGCAFRTPPYRVGVTDLPIPAIPPLVASLREFYSTLPGISGPEPAASELARAWTERYGGGWSVHSRQRLLSLASVEPLNDAPEGSLRLAADADAPVAHAWGTALARDSGVTALNGAFCARLIRGQRLYLWDDGVPRCMVGVLRETSEASAVGIVYTPPELRGKHYATNAIAALSRRLLERRRHCFLYADPASSTMRAICERLGYQCVEDTVDIDFA